MLERRLILPAALRDQSGALTSFQDGDKIVFTASDIGIGEAYCKSFHVERQGKKLSILQRNEDGSENKIDRIRTSSTLKQTLSTFETVLSLCLPIDLCTTTCKAPNENGVWHINIVSFKRFGKSMQKSALKNS